MGTLKNRKGVFVVIFGILFMAMMAAAALSMDFARIWAMRNELQTSADAGALGGAIQIGLPPDNEEADIRAEATALAQRNRAMGAVVAVDEVRLGQWTDATGFTPDVTPTNAVKVTVAHATNGLIMSALGIAAPRVRAVAIAWADAPISNTNCIRPWAIPYEVLMGRLNQKRTDNSDLITNPFTRTNLTRAFDPIRDMAILKDPNNASILSFSLKLGQNDPAKTALEEGVLTNGMPGNFQAVVLPKSWDFATQSATNPAPQPGGSAYKDAIMGKYCYSLAVGDRLLTETGNKTQPTIDAADKSNNQTAPYGVCEEILDGKQGSTVDMTIHGNCVNSQGGVGVDIKAAFYYCPSSCQGRSEVEVKLLGSFRLDKIFPDGDGGKDKLWDKSEIRGVFKPIEDSGPVGGTSSTLRTVILVK